KVGFHLEHDVVDRRVVRQVSGDGALLGGLDRPRAPSEIEYQIGKRDGRRELCPGRSTAAEPAACTAGAGRVDRAAARSAEPSARACAARRTGQVDVRI